MKFVKKINSNTKERADPDCCHSGDIRTALRDILCQKQKAGGAGGGHCRRRNSGNPGSS